MFVRAWQELFIAGKHPVGNEWQKRASTDEEHLTDLLMSRELSNIGIQWGPNSGVIDIEFDDEKGRAAAKGGGWKNYSHRRLRQLDQLIESVAGHLDCRSKP